MDLFEASTGGRLHHVYFRPGGVYEDLPAGWTDRAQAFLEEFLDRLKEYHELVTGNPIFLARVEGVGVLPRDAAINLGACGPVARGSGVDFDVRKAFPYEAYGELDFDVPIYPEGDCFARYNVRMEEMRQSVRLIRQAIAKLPSGEIRSKVPVNVKLPKGEAYARTESPRGDLGVYLVSEGDDTPYRVKIRAPSFSNLYAMVEMMRGWKVADVIAILGSVDIVLSDVDR